MQLIHHPIPGPRTGLSIVAIRVDRLLLAKRRWRAAAEDGVEFGFELEQALSSEAVVWETEAKQYKVLQNPEPLLEVSLEIAPSAAAGIGWAVGNLHLDLSANGTCLLTPDDPAARQLFQRLGVQFNVLSAVFRPGRFSRGSIASNATQDLGASHRH